MPAGFACSALPDSLVNRVSNLRSLCTMRQKRTEPYSDTRKTINMPPALWKQIEARLRCYEPELDFTDWARRIFQDELRRPPRVLPDWLAQPKDGLVNLSKVCAAKAMRIPTLASVGLKFSAGYVQMNAHGCVSCDYTNELQSTRTHRQEAAKDLKATGRRGGGRVPRYG
jgi:hypothetical protein